MRSLLQVLGWGSRGHPIHPPLTDVVVGSLTVCIVAVVVGWLGFLEERMVDVAFMSAVIGLAAAIPTALTGVLDYLRIPRGSNLRRTVTLHWVGIAFALIAFAAAAALLQPADNGGEMPLAGGILAVTGWLALLFGAWVGGGVVFFHGMRVINKPDAPTSEAVRPKLPPD